MVATQRGPGSPTLSATLVQFAPPSRETQRYPSSVPTQRTSGFLGDSAIAEPVPCPVREISGEITPQTVIETIKAMPEAELPGGGGVMLQCNGSADPALPAVCTYQSLRTQLDAQGEPTEYEVVDSSELLAQ